MERISKALLSEVLEEAEPDALERSAPIVRGETLPVMGPTQVYQEHREMWVAVTVFLSACQKVGMANQVQNLDDMETLTLYVLAVVAVGCKPHHVASALITLQANERWFPKPETVVSYALRVKREEEEARLRARVIEEMAQRALPAPEPTPEEEAERLERVRLMRKELRKTNGLLRDLYKPDGTPRRSTLEDRAARLAERESKDPPAPST